MCVSECTAWANILEHVGMSVHGCGSYVGEYVIIQCECM